MFLTMNTRANSIQFAASFRWLAAVFSVVILLSGLFPSHAGTRFAAGGLHEVSISAMQADNDSQPASPDGMPDHVAGQCSCGISVLPHIMARPVPPLVRSIRFTMTAPPFSPFGDLAPPSEPPRA